MSIQKSDATKLRYAKRELGEEIRKNRLLLEELRLRRQWGQMMSNLCFNLAQCDKYDPTHRQSMRDCREGWDKISCRPSQTEQGGRGNVNQEGEENV